MSSSGVFGQFYPGSYSHPAHRVPHVGDGDRGVSGHSGVVLGSSGGINPMSCSCTCAWPGQTGIPTVWGLTAQQTAYHMAQGNAGGDAAAGCGRYGGRARSRWRRRRHRHRLRLRLCACSLRHRLHAACQLLCSMMCILMLECSCSCFAGALHAGGEHDGRVGRARRRLVDHARRRHRRLAASGPAKCCGASS